MIQYNSSDTYIPSRKITNKRRRMKRHRLSTCISVLPTATVNNSTTAQWLLISPLRSWRHKFLFCNRFLFFLLPLGTLMSRSGTVLGTILDRMSQLDSSQSDLFLGQQRLFTFLYTDPGVCVRAATGSHP